MSNRNEKKNPTANPFSLISSHSLVRLYRCHSKQDNVPSNIRLWAVHRELQRRRHAAYFEPWQKDPLQSMSLAELRQVVDSALSSELLRWVVAKEMEARHNSPAFQHDNQMRGVLPYEFYPLAA